MALARASISVRGLALVGVAALLLLAVGAATRRTRWWTPGSQPWLNRMATVAGHGCQAKRRP